LNKEDRIRDEVEKTLSVFDRIKNIEGNPFMYTRLKAEIDSRSGVKKKSVFAPGLKAVPILLLLVLFSVNLVSVIHYLKSSNTGTERESYISSFAKEYNLSTSYNYIRDINIED
jgi:hypothetical protein